MKPVDIDVTVVSDSKWWVGDNRLPESDPASLIGVIRRKDDGFESVRFAHHDETVRFHSSSMAEAVLYFALSDQPHASSGNTAWWSDSRLPD